MQENVRNIVPASVNIGLHSPIAIAPRLLLYGYLQPKCRPKSSPSVEDIKMKCCIPFK